MSAPRGTGVRLLGRLAVQLSGRGQLYDEVDAELATLPAATEVGTEAVRFTFSERVPPIQGLQYGKLTVGTAGDLRVEDPTLVYQLRLCAPAGAAVVVAPATAFDDAGVGGRVRQWRNWNYLTRSQIAAKDFFYNVFDYVTQICQMRLGQSYVHAGAVERDGVGLLLAGWGGAGKTTAMLTMVIERGWRFLSDDLGLIDTDGTIWRSPKRIQIYGYNLVGEPRLAERVFAQMSVPNRLSWELKLRRHGIRGVRRRVSPEQLFSRAALADSAPVQKVLLLSRGDTTLPIRRPIASQEFARRATSTLVRELDPLSGVLSAYHSAPPTEHTLPDLAELTEMSRSIIAAAVADVAIEELVVPASAGPRVLLDLIDSAASP